MKKKQIKNFRPSSKTKRQLNQFLQDGIPQKLVVDLALNLIYEGCISRYNNEPMALDLIFIDNLYYYVTPPKTPVQIFKKQSKALKIYYSQNYINYGTKVTSPNGKFITITINYSLTQDNTREFIDLDEMKDYQVTLHINPTKITASVSNNMVQNILNMETFTIDDEVIIDKIRKLAEL